MNNDPTNSLSFFGLASHTLKVQKPEELTSAGMEAALKRLKSSMAMIEQDKEAKKYYLTDAHSNERKVTNDFIQDPALHESRLTAKTRKAGYNWQISTFSAPQEACHVQQ